MAMIITRLAVVVTAFGVQPSWMRGRDLRESEKSSGEHEDPVSHEWSIRQMQIDVEKPSISHWVAQQIWLYDISNNNQITAEMFSHWSDRPHCGLNTRPSRSWVDLYQMRGKRFTDFANCHALPNKTARIACAVMYLKVIFAVPAA